MAKALVWLLASLPVGVQRGLARGLGTLAFGLGIRRQVTLENLRHAFPAWSEPSRRKVALGAYRNMAQVAVEALTSARRTREALAEVVEFESLDRFEQARAQGRGVLIATAHYGSWELVGEALAARGMTLNAVVKPLKGALNDQIVRSRLHAGVRLIHARGAISQSVKALRRGEVVVMLIDQSIAAGHGVFVPFFGRLASTSPALSLVAARSGAPVLVGMGTRVGEKIRVSFEGPFELPQVGTRAEGVRAHTAQVTAAIERHIRAHPEQWLWLHRRWKVAPPPGADPALGPASAAE
jgi:Kdo2-lipid IVA lauroyltransferase/acyltransferase